MNKPIMTADWDKPLYQPASIPMFAEPTETSWTRWQLLEYQFAVSLTALVPDVHNGWEPPPVEVSEVDELRQPS